MPFTVVGVAEQGFRGLTIQGAGAWLPVTMQPAVDHGFGRDSILPRDWSWLTMAARLAPGARIETARAQLTIAASQRAASTGARGGKRVYHAVCSLAKG